MSQGESYDENGKLHTGSAGVSAGMLCSEVLEHIDRLQAMIWKLMH